MNNKYFSDELSLFIIAAVAVFGILETMHPWSDPRIIIDLIAVAGIFVMTNDLYKALQDDE